jgi:hypothetical protein
MDTSRYNLPLGCRYLNRYGFRFQLFAQLMIVLLICVTIQPAEAQPSGDCIDWQYSHCFMNNCAPGKDDIAASQCVAFLHGVLAAFYEERMRHSEPVGICIPPGITSRYIVERVAVHFKAEAVDGRIRDQFTARPMLKFIRETFPCP